MIDGNRSALLASGESRCCVPGRGGIEVSAETGDIDSKGRAEGGTYCPVGMGYEVVVLDGYGNEARGVEVGEVSSL